MTTARASEVLRALARHEQATQMQALAGLDASARAAIRRALSAVKPTAPIDVAVLVSTIRSRVSRPSRDEVVASIEGRLRAIAERLHSLPGKPGGEQMSPAERMALELFPQPAATPGRRSIPRVRSRRALTPDSPESPAPDAPAPVKRAKTAPRTVAAGSSGPAFFAGPRLLGPGIDYDPRAWTPKPPWLLDDEGDDEPDEEILDDDIVDEARALEARD